MKRKSCQKYRVLSIREQILDFRYQVTDNLWERLLKSGIYAFLSLIQNICLASTVAQHSAQLV